MDGGFLDAWLCARRALPFSPVMVILNPNLMESEITPLDETEGISGKQRTDRK